MELIWIVCLNENLRCVGCAKTEEERSAGVTTLLKMFLMHGIALLIDLKKDRLQDEGRAPPSRSASLSASRSRFVAGCNI